MSNPLADVDIPDASDMYLTLPDGEPVLLKVLRATQPPQKPRVEPIITLAVEVPSLPDGDPRGKRRVWNVTSAKCAKALKVALDAGPWVRVTRTGDGYERRYRVVSAKMESADEPRGGEA